VKNYFLIILTSLVFNLGNIKEVKSDINEFFERNKIYNKCMEDENNIFIYGLRREEYCNCYVRKYMNKSIPILASLECHADTLDKAEFL
tara:strand:- start:362 stop:628 length:267 start_codon:yes stop_codon:yes gene_type:complete